MLFYTVGQPQIFLGMMYAGLAAGLLYDITGGIRTLLEAGKVLTLVIDSLYSLLCVIVLTAVWVHVNYMDLRFYALLGAACGAILYALTLRPLLKLIVIRPAKGLLRLLRRFAQIKFVKKVFR